MNTVEALARGRARNCHPTTFMSPAMLGDMGSRGCGGVGSDMIGRTLPDRLGTYVQGN